MPNGLTRWGRTAWTVLAGMGLLHKTQSAMEYVVNTEFNAGITKSVMTTGSQANYVFQGMTNRYKEFCNGNAWTAGCLNGFWAYHQGPLTGADATNYGADTPTIKNVASAILHPGQEFDGIVTSKDWTGCKAGSANICHYALPRPELETWIRTSALPYPNADNPVGWSYNPYSAPSEKLYAWNNIDSLFVVMSQAMWDNFNLNHPTYLWGQ